MPTYKITAPDGTVLKITGNQPPSGEQIKNIFAEREKSSLMADEAQADATLTDMKAFLSQRGNNLGGAARQIAIGAIPGALRAEAAYRADANAVEDTKRALSELTPEQKEYLKANPDKMVDWVKNLSAQRYEKYKQNAYESAEGFQRAHPYTSIALQLGGGALPALATVGGSTAATGAGLAGRATVGALTGAGVGGLYGFMGDPSEEISDRLTTAAGSAGLGGLVGGATPLATGVIGATGRGARRVISGLGSAPEREKIYESLLTIAPNVSDKSARKAATTLLSGSLAGAEDIQNAAYNLALKRENMARLSKPGLVDYNLSPQWAADTPSASRIIQAYESPAESAAKQHYSNWLANTPENASGAGLAVNRVFKKYPAFQKVLEKDIAENPLKWEGVPLSSREGMGNLINLASEYAPKRPALSGTRAATKQDIVETLRDLDEKFYPGSREARAIYRVGKTDTEVASQRADTALRQIGQMPITEAPALSLSQLSRMTFKPYARGKAFELINKGDVSNALGRGWYLGTSAAADDILRALREVGN